jgi:hypothetical protein
MAFSLPILFAVLTNAVALDDSSLKSKGGRARLSPTFLSAHRKGGKGFPTIFGDG